MKKTVLALWIAISVAAVSLIGIWAFAWYYFIYQGNSRGGSHGSAGEEREVSSVYSGGELAGTVKDADTGDPIVGASVQWQLEEYASSVSTDGAGGFLISDLEPGEYRLRVTMEGYRDSSRMRITVDEDTTTVLLDDILLKREVDFYQYLREVHIPEAGSASRQSLTVGNTLNMESMGQLLQPVGGLGFLSGDVRDYDGDGEKELIVIDTVCTMMGETDLGRLGFHKGDEACFALELSLYGDVNGQVQCLDSVYITEIDKQSWGPMIFGVQEQEGIFYFYGYSCMEDIVTYGSRPFTIYHVEEKKLVMDYIGGSIGWGQGHYEGDANAALGTRDLSILDTPLEYVYNCLIQFQASPEEVQNKLEGSIFTCITMEPIGNSIQYQAADYTYIWEILEEGEAAIRERRPDIPKEYQQPKQAPGIEEMADQWIYEISAASGVPLTKTAKDVREDVCMITYQSDNSTMVRITFDQATQSRKALMVSSSGGNRSQEWTALKDACLSLPEFGIDQNAFAEYFGNCSFNLGNKESGGVTVFVGNAGTCVLNIWW
ncbi:MAG: carboxypeptidase regulatory-like domain-containing protein [Lachnospiraceae bacterium]|jgi:hypothetical protein|nr:carboxypeptidase regulatory-like domain-containing protein [Lachnospiraceae bacterium]